MQPVPSLRGVEDQAILRVFELQRQVGLQIFRDGEFRRKVWHEALESAAEGVGDAGPDFELWSKPMTKVAADLGVSDVAAHKIFVKHRIPVPGRGYRAKRAAGKPVTAALFHELKDSSLNRVTVHGSALAEMPRRTRSRARPF
jgi:hypothetical protein